MRFSFILCERRHHGVERVSPDFFSSVRLRPLLAQALAWTPQYPEQVLVLTSIIPGERLFDEVTQEEFYGDEEVERFFFVQ